MKFGHAEGTPHELKNSNQDNGLKAEDYFQVPEKPLTSPVILLDRKKT